MSKVRAAEIFVEYLNFSREMQDYKDLTQLQLEIMCILYIKKQQKYNINPSDIHRLTNYRYTSEIYKQTKQLVEKGYVDYNIKKTLKKDRRFYMLTVKGLNAIEKILDTPL